MTDPRILAILEQISELADGRYNRRLDPSTTGDALDAVVEGLNTLAEKLALARERERNARHLAETDPLTSLPNRRAFGEALEQAIHHREEHRHLALIFIDLDKFKKVNDAHGHAVGDAALKHVANALDSSIRDRDLAARIGGDEFAVLIPHLKKTETAAKVAERIRHRICEPLNEHPDVTVAATLGIAFAPDDANTADELLQAADRRMYANKPRRTG